MITQYVSCATDMLLKGGSRQKSVGYVKKTSDKVFLMENFSFIGTCLLELRVGFPRGGSVGCLFFILYSQILMDVRQVIEGDFVCPFCFLFYFKSIGLENVLCVEMAPVVPITVFFFFRPFTRGNL